jgi:hypothetical protein
VQTTESGHAQNGRAADDPVELWQFSLLSGTAVLVNGDISVRFDGLAFDPPDVLYGLSQGGDL